MKITVTAECIANGRRNKGCDCPIALAIATAVPGGKWRPFVNTDRVKVYDRYGHPSTLPLPDKAQWFIDAFDHGRPVEPFEFELPTEGP